MILNLKLCLTLLSLNAVQRLFAERNRIFDGQDLRHDVHKYLVKLKLIGQYKTGQYCSGSILNSQWVITAGHCITPDLVKIHVQHYKCGDMKVIGKVDVNQIIWHHRYQFDTALSSENRAYDLALLKTRRPLKFDKYAQPIRLSSKTPKVGQLAIIAGYGENENLDEKAKEGNVVLTECSDGLLCSRNSVSAGNGDSGGALVSRGRLVGVTSASCKDTHEPKPCLTVYVDIAKNVKWIKKAIET